MNKKWVLNLLIVSFKDLLRPRVLFYFLLPILGSLIFWGAITFFLWPNLAAAGIFLFNSNFIQLLVLKFSPFFILTSAPFILFIKAFTIIGIMIPMLILSTFIMISVFLIPVIVEDIRKKDYPQLIKNPAHFYEALKKTSYLSAKYFFIWIGTFPIWFFIPAANVIIPFILLTWFNSRMFSYEILLELMPKKSADLFFEKYKKDIWILGTLTTFFYFIPVFNLIAPLFTAFLFTRLILNRVPTNNNTAMETI